MKVAILDSKGFYGTTWDGPNLKFDRTAVGPGETFEIINLEPVVPPIITNPPTMPPYDTWTSTDEDWFSTLVYGKPFGQETLLALEPFLRDNGWTLTPANAEGARTKVLPAGAGKHWVRVGFGEGYWVWVVQP